MSSPFLFKGGFGGFLLGVEGRSENDGVERHRDMFFSSKSSTWNAIQITTSSKRKVIFQGQQRIGAFGAMATMFSWQGKIVVANLLISSVACILTTLRFLNLNFL